TTIHFVRGDDTILTGARAVLAAGRLVPRWRFLAIALDNRAGHAVLEPLYRQVATHRRRIGRLLGLPVECPLPPRKGETVCRRAVRSASATERDPPVTPPAGVRPLDED